MRPWLRALILTGLWLPVAGGALIYLIQASSGLRFDFLLSFDGTISVVQLESFSEADRGLQPYDRLQFVDGKAFQKDLIRKWLKERKPGQTIEIQFTRGNETKTTKSLLRRYNRSALFSLGILPLVLSLVFFVLALVVPSRRVDLRRNREAVEVFGALLFWISIFFALFHPAMTAAVPISLSAIIPWFGGLLVHLSLCYPKKKGRLWVRLGALSAGYGLSALLSSLRLFQWERSGLEWMNAVTLWHLGLCFLIALALLGNTLFSSRDFWARRRARLLSLVYLTTFIGAASAFAAFAFEVPRLSFERILGLSLFFPTAFAVVFFKNNVFDLERVFRRGLPQVLLIMIATIFAILVGVGWSQWRASAEDDWMLWVAIAMVVVWVARPLGSFLERSVHRLIQTNVTYPNVNQILQRAPTRDAFLRLFFTHCARDLNFKELSIRFLRDPLKPWSESNEIIFRYRDGELQRLHEPEKTELSFFSLTRGDFPVGRLYFIGGDDLAFDPHHSREWSATLKALTTVLELITLRDFISTQESFLAVARMQSLLAHEMKNPLAIIKVCAGLLDSKLQYDSDPEISELLRTIQDEVRRVSQAVQSVFNHSAKPEAKAKVDLTSILTEVSEAVHARFPDRMLTWIIPDRMPALWVEANSLRQSLLNLVVNAFEAGAHKVDLMVTHEPELLIRIQDDGPGIPKSIELFKPFMTTKPSGTGLGLSHVKAFVDRNEGSIRVDSKEGQGSCFTLELGRGMMMES